MSLILLFRKEKKNIVMLMLQKKLHLKYTLYFNYVDLYRFYNNILWLCQKICTKLNYPKTEIEVHALVIVIILMKQCLFIVIITIGLCSMTSVMYDKKIKFRALAIACWSHFKNAIKMLCIHLTNFSLLMLSSRFFIQLFHHRLLPSLRLLK